MHIHVCTGVHTYAGLCVHASKYMWRPDSNLRSHPPVLCVCVLLLLVFYLLVCFLLFCDRLN